jgi:aryl-alcohol dehydrogenase-like predicted oxidoreductase
MNRRELLTGGLRVAAAMAIPGSAASGGDILTRTVPASGEQLPVIGLGTSGPFEVGASPAARTPLAAVLSDFFAAGGRLIDTSPMYSSAEDVLGELLSDSQRERALLATKVWTRGRRSGLEQMTHSLERLGRARLDLIQVHNLLDLDTQLRTLRAWRDAGRVRYIGITHYTVSAHAELARVIEREPLDFVQFNYSPVTRAAEQRLLPLAAERGVAVLINRPFEDGALFAAVRHKPLPPWAAELDAGSWGQLALKFIVSHPAVTCAIPATGNPAHLRDNLGGGRGPLPDAAHRELIARAFA